MEFDGEFRVEGRKYLIKNYEVIFAFGKYNCNCKGFKIKKKCKHILEVQREGIFFEEKELLEKNIVQLLTEFSNRHPEVQQINFVDNKIQMLI